MRELGAGGRSERWWGGGGGGMVGGTDAKVRTRVQRGLLVYSWMAGRGH